MIIERMKLQTEGSLPDAHFIAYVLDTPGDLHIKKRPMVILCPGGGYERTSFREGEPIAMYFLQKGYHVGILRYSTAPAKYPTAFLELGMAMGIVKGHSEEWKVDERQIFVQGSSAGGHLAGCLGVFWNSTFLSKKLGIPSEKLRPAGLLLSYPVISSDENISHKGSFLNLLQDEYEEKKEMLSLERQVTEYTVPCFIWHTFEDRTVPVQNSVRMAEALHEKGIRTVLHLFQKGSHGLGSAGEESRRADGSGVQEECQCWMDLAYKWMENICKDQ